MQVLRAGLDQAADAQALLREYYAAAGVVKRDTVEDVRGFLAGEAKELSGFWIAYAEGVPMGCVALRPLESVAKAAEGKRLFVRVDFRGRGTAEALLDALESAAFGAGAEWIYLDSTEEMQAAVRLYLRRGYERCERYNDNPQATMFLRKARVGGWVAGGCGR